MNCAVSASPLAGDLLARDHVNRHGFLA